MAGEASQAGAHIMLDAMTGRSTAAVPTNTYLALCTTAPTDTALGTEVTTPATNGYDREAVTWTAPSAGSTENTALITFGPFTSDLGNVTHCMLMPATTGGTATDMLAWWALDAARDPSNGDSIQVSAGSLTMTAT